MILLEVCPDAAPVRTIILTYLQSHNYIIQTTLAEKALKYGSSIPIQSGHHLTIAPLGPHRLMCSSSTSMVFDSISPLQTPNQPSFFLCIYAAGMNLYSMARLTC